MYALHQPNRGAKRAIVALAVLGLAACSSMGHRDRGAVALNGEQEVPPVMTSASGSGTIMVGADKSVSGGVTTTGVAGTMAHIHMALKGKNGPVIIPLTKSGAGTWSVPAGARLTDAQYEAYRAGGLYVNVHSAAHKAGEVRGQLQP